MKVNTLEILMSLFTQQASQANKGLNPMTPEQAFLLAFSKEKDIKQAISWLDALVSQVKKLSTPAHNHAHTNIKLHTGSIGSASRPPALTFLNKIHSSLRIYADPEQIKLGHEGIALLEELVQIKVLSLAQREIVIDQLMQLDNDEIPLHHLRWLLFVALASGASSAEQLCWLDCLVLKDHKNKHKNKNTNTLALH